MDARRPLSGIPGGRVPGSGGGRRRRPPGAAAYQSEGAGSGDSGASTFVIRLASALAVTVEGCVVAAGRGGAGGDGGRGGHGGGGPSIGIACLGASAASVFPATTFTIAPACAGGASSGTAGAAGQELSTLGC